MLLNICTFSYYEHVSTLISALSSRPHCAWIKLLLRCLRRWNSPSSSVADPDSFSMFKIFYLILNLKNGDYRERTWRSNRWRDLKLETEIWWEEFCFPATLAALRQQVGIDPNRKKQASSWGQRLCLSLTYMHTLKILRAHKCLDRQAHTHVISGWLNPLLSQNHLPFYIRLHY